MKNALIPGHDGRRTSPLTDHLTTSNFGTTHADNVAGRAFSSKQHIWQNPMHQSQGPNVTHTPKMTEELKRGALNITEQRSACESAMESGISLMQGETVSSRQCGRICVSIRKASDREQLHHPDITNTSRRTCSHHPPCLTSSKLILLCWIYGCQYRTDLYCNWVLKLSICWNFLKDISELHSLSCALIPLALAREDTVTD